MQLLQNQSEHLLFIMNTIEYLFRLKATASSIGQVHLLSHKRGEQMTPRDSLKRVSRIQISLFTPLKASSSQRGGDIFLRIQFL